MTDSLILIGKSGALAARGALDVTGQNIANAATEGYQRRSVELAEIASRGGIGLRKDSVLSGVRIDGIRRAGSDYLHGEARRTNSDLARADAELGVLRQAETALEAADVFGGLVGFEARLAELAADPLSPALRSSALESARVLGDSFRIADSGLAAAAQQARFEADDGVRVFNGLAEELAKNNLALGRTEVGGGNHAALLDRRDALLAEMGDLAAISVGYDKQGAASVRIGDASGPVAVSAGTVSALEITDAADGALAFSVSGEAAALAAGSLAGRSQGLARLAAARSELDGLAQQVVTLANNAQASGADPSGNPGAPIFSGSSAATIALALDDPAGLATAPAGSGANSRDPANLTAFSSALATGPVAGADTLLFSLSSTIAGRETTREALSAIAASAGSALSNTVAVDLDVEAANLLRFQQAFQASSRVIQVAADIFDTMLGIR